MKQSMLFKPEELNFELVDSYKKSEIITGNAVEIIKKYPDEYFQLCITSPPYWGLRDYGINHQIGAEFNLDNYISNLLNVFKQVYRTLKKNGTLWLNIGDSYTSGNRKRRDDDKKNPARGMSYRPPTPEGLKPKDLIGIPWRLAFALQNEGWYLRSDIIWYKPNCQPESVKDRPTRSHEYLFLFSKSEKYLYNIEDIMEKTDNGNYRNKRTVWSINTKPYPGAHFATFPENLIEPCVLAGSKKGDKILDPFFGSGTTGIVSLKHYRSFVGIDINKNYIELAKNRIKQLFI